MSYEDIKIVQPIAFKESICECGKDMVEFVKCNQALECLDYRIVPVGCKHYKK